jgi:hypothetical protein
MSQSFPTNDDKDNDLLHNHLFLTIPTHTTQCILSAIKAYHFQSQDKRLNSLQNTIHRSIVSTASQNALDCTFRITKRGADEAPVQEKFDAVFKELELPHLMGLNVEPCFPIISGPQRENHVHVIVNSAIHSILTQGPDTLPSLPQLNRI